MAAEVMAAEVMAAEVMAIDCTPESRWVLAILQLAMLSLAL
jgi:hypothetical protein